MSKPVMNQNFFGEVHHHITERLQALDNDVPPILSFHELGTGKMLRSTLVQRLSEFDLPGFDPKVAQAACAATEIVHTASLCHDDIIDQAMLRRGRPAVWQKAGIPGALLAGDLLLVESFGILAAMNTPGMIQDFTEKLKTLCLSEINQEVNRGMLANEQRWRSICCGKTGTLFAFPARWSCWRNPELAVALEQAGLLLGCAYQMFDDILDILGDEKDSGKTLGTDSQRDKHTIPGTRQQQREYVTKALAQTLEYTVVALEEHPIAQAAIKAYIEQDMMPVFRTTLPSLQVSCIAEASSYHVA